jgi:acetyltransferase-like isoleucine patch superfamily enzyme
VDVPIRLQGKVSSKGIRVEDDVWIGAGCILLDGAHVGAGSILTPNSVVSGRIPKARSPRAIPRR